MLSELVLCGKRPLLPGKVAVISHSQQPGAPVAHLLPGSLPSETVPDLYNLESSGHRQMVENTRILPHPQCGQSGKPLTKVNDLVTL